MSDIPDTIPIAPPEGGELKSGHSPDGRQFLARLVEAPEGWVALLQWFAAEGDHLENDHDGPFAGREDAVSALDAMLDRLQPMQLEPVTISVFEDEVEGAATGLAADGEGLKLMPDGPRFSAPWDGAPQG